MRLRRTPLVLQMEAAECGAAALAMTLAAHGRWITLEEAREACGTSRDGVTAAGIVEAARSFGLKAEAFRREPEQLADLPMPQVLHWCFDHFVVLERISGSRFVVLDPAHGRVTYDRESFSDRFTGVVIAFEPTADFKRGGRPPSIAKALFAEASRSPDGIAVAFMTGVLAMIPGLALAGALGILVNHVLGARQTGWIPFLLAALCGIVLAKATLALIAARTIANWKIKIGSILALASLTQALRLPLGYFAQRSAGEVVARVRIGSELGGAIAGPLAQTLPHMALIAGFLLVVGLYDVTIMAAALVTAAACFAVLFWILRRLADRTREHQLAEGRAAAVGTTGMDNLGVYTLLGRENLLLARWAAAEDAAIAAEQRLGPLRVLAKLGPAACGLALSGVVLAVCGVRAMEGVMTLGDLVALQVLSSLLGKPISALAAGFCAIQESAGALMRLGDLERHKPAAGFAEKERAPAPAPVAGHLSLRGVSFAHTPGRAIFTDLSLEIAPGRMVAIVGPTGAGKSTLARLCAGMLDPGEGEVSLDGRSLADWPQAELRGALAYVGQTAATFSGSIAENVTLFDPSVPPEAVREAVRRAGLLEAVSRRPLGLDSKIVGGASTFSGGERQRLAIARALVRAPRVFVLDEPTSALDPVSEEAIMEELRATGATVLVVTHREGTAMRCDEAIVVGPGGEIARGTPAALFPQRLAPAAAQPHAAFSPLLGATGAA